MDTQGFEWKDKYKNNLIFSRETDKILPAFIKFQNGINLTKMNGDLQEIKKPLAENRLAIFHTNIPMPMVSIKKKAQKIDKYGILNWDGKYITIDIREICTECYLIHESGQWIKTQFISIPEDNSDYAREASLAYGKKCTISCLCGIVTDYPEDNKMSNDTSLPEYIKTGKYNEDYIDVNGIKRYNKTKRCFNDEYQEINGLITTDKWREIIDLIDSNLNGNFDSFLIWLSAEYKCNFFDIPKGAVDNIIIDLENITNSSFSRSYLRGNSNTSEI